MVPSIEINALLRKPGVSGSNCPQETFVLPRIQLLYSLMNKQRFRPAMGGNCPSSPYAHAIMALMQKFPNVFKTVHPL